MNEPLPQTPQSGDKPNASAAMTMPANRIGIVAIGRNEGARLVRCLESLSRTGHTYVYVDSASTDGSGEHARKLGAKVVDLDMTLPFTAARARNAGAEALFKVDPAITMIQFVDGDCELAPDWIDSAERFLNEHQDVAVVCGRRRERFPDASIYNRLCDIEWNTPIGEATACGGDCLMRAGVFRAAGGYDPTMTAGEEAELCGRIRSRGWRIWRIDTEMTLHDADIRRLGQWWKRGVRTGVGYAQVWGASNRGPDRIYELHLKRAAFWGGAVPLAAVATAPILPWLGAGIALLPAAQVTRIALRRGVTDAFSWRYAGLMMLAKLPELQGALRYWRKGRRGVGSAVEYK